MNLFRTWMLITAIITVILPDSVLTAQQRLCRGSLGENIFEEGGFGTGRSVLYPSDPALAPGYSYTTWMPPNDGFYTITNNTDGWEWIWPTWLTIRDNSPDQHGYMMVINASYQPGIFYEKIVEGICENTLYEFSADVINLIMSGTLDHIYPNVSFLIDGIERYYTGSIPQNEQWKDVGFTFTTDPGQTEVRLTLRNNAPGGRGNDIAIDNISFRACGPHASINTAFPNVLCENSDFPILNADIWGAETRAVQWQISGDNGNTWKDVRNANVLRFKVPKQAAGEYQVRYVHAASKSNLSSQKCRALSEVFYLTVRPSIVRRNVTLQAGQTYAMGGSQYRTSGIYRQTYPSSTGCDSTVIVTLTVETDTMEPVFDIRQPTCHQATDGQILLTALAGGLAPFTYSWSHGENGKLQTGLKAGFYSVTLTDANGSTALHTIELVDPSPLSVQIEMSSDNRPTAIASGGLSPYTYTWSSGETTATARTLEPGSQSILARDSNGCELRKTVDVKYIAEARLIPELTIESLRSGQAIRMERVQFDADSSTIRSNSLPALKELHQFLLEHPAVMVEIGGHTNGLPAHDYCDRLSASRAKAIADWIVVQGIEASRVSFRGYGKRQPVSTNATLEGRRKNQRVEVRMLDGDRK